MKHIDISEIKEKDYLGKEVIVCGWVRTSRDSKNVAFLEINDGTSFEHLQIVLDKEIIDNSGNFLRLGISVCVEGEVVAALSGKGVEINAKNITLIGDCPLDYPLQKKRHTLEYLRTIPHLRLRTNTFNAVFRLRSKVSAAIHDFFNKNNFVWIHTPIVTGSDCEGAGEMFKITSLGYAPQYKSEKEYYEADFFGKKAGLSVSGQLEGEVAAMAMGKIYTFGPSFRAENSNTPRHLAEFWHIEPEVAFASLNDVLALAEDMVKWVLNTVMKECAAELNFFEQHFEKGLIEKLNNVKDNKFEVLEYTKAIDLLLESGKAFQYPVEWGCDLQTEHERYITEEIFKKPVFVINYPKCIKSFYMKQNEDGKTVAAADLLVPGVGEIIGGSEREADYEKLLSALTERKMPVETYEDYIALRRFGTVPHGGFGLGLERLIMYMTGITNIRDVILYPRSVGSLR